MKIAAALLFLLSVAPFANGRGPDSGNETPQVNLLSLRGPGSGNERLQDRELLNWFDWLRGPAGPAGPPGAAGPSNVEIVPVLGPAILAPFATLVLTATCPPGKKLIGGGCRGIFDPGAGSVVWVFGSFALSDTTWQCIFSNNVTPNPTPPPLAQVICANVLP